MAELNGMAGSAPAECELPEPIDPAHAEFVVGFPCTRFGCRGSLRRERHRAAPAVTCAVCEQVYYVITE